MPSHLTRRVFSRLLANEPIIPRGCLRRQLRGPTRLASRLARRPGLSHNVSLRVSIPQRRSFLDFNLFAPKKQHLQEADLDPGIDLMMSLAKRERISARMPPVEDVAHALKSLFTYKRRENESFRDYQAQLALQSLRYLLAQVREQEKGDVRESRRAVLSDDVLSQAAAVLRIDSDTSTEAHCELAKAIHAELLMATFRDQYRSVSAYVRVLSALGKAVEARDVVVSFETRLDAGSVTGKAADTDSLSEPGEDLPSESSSAALASSSNASAMASLWTLVLHAYAKGDSESELLSVLEILKQKGYDRARRVPMAMLDFYLRNNNSSGIKSWFSKSWEAQSTGQDRQGKSGKFMAADLHRVLQWCLTTKNLDFGHDAVRLVMAENPPKEAWDAIFVWAAGTGKGADEIDRMLCVMESSNQSIPNASEWRLPDIATINGLVAFATSKHDPYLAERFLAIATKRDLLPDAATYVLQMDYRLNVNDIDGALIAYQNLQAMDISSNADVPAVNRLLVALCSSRRHDFDTIMNVAGDLSDRQARFDPQTVATLSILHLARDEVHDVVDLLNTHAAHYSTSERDVIRDALLAFCLDPETDTPISWDTYSLLRNTFDDLPRAPRTAIMLHFFQRQRADMAVHVFTHMRAHTRPTVMPTLDTYISAFLAAGRLRDAATLDVIHNQLKLDFTIEPTTRLRNALLAAYTACGHPRRALAFWDDIVASPEGPTYNSLHIALRACEKAPFGDRTAQQIWRTLRSRHIALDPPLWASYIAALAGNGDLPRAMATLEAAVRDDDLPVDPFLLASLFAASPGQAQQAQVENWAQQHFPAVWAQLLAMGYDEEENGMRAFRVDRSVAP